MHAVLHTMRYWLPLLAALGCLIVAGWVSPIAGWLLMALAFGLILDAGTALFAKAGRVGSIRDNKQ